MAGNRYCCNIISVPIIVEQKCGILKCLPHAQVLLPFLITVIVLRVDRSFFVMYADSLFSIRGGCEALSVSARHCGEVGPPYSAEEHDKCCLDGVDDKGEEYCGLFGNAIKDEHGLDGEMPGAGSVGRGDEDGEGSDAEDEESGEGGNVAGEVEGEEG